MMDFSGLFEMQGTLFLIMLLGMFLRKKRIINDGGKTMLSNLVIDVTLPASIFNSFENDAALNISSTYEIIFKITVSTGNDRSTDISCNMDAIFMIIYSE